MCLSKDAGGMGFRDIQAFNLAMLGKQSWHLATNLDSLLARSLKARYYPRTSLLEAQKVHNSSYSWRSILDTQGLLKKGIRWRVGNGTDISVWNDGRLPKNIQFKASPPLVEVDQDMKVCDLINEDRSAWDRETIRQIFNPEDAKQILMIPLSSRNTQDSLL